MFEQPPDPSELEEKSGHERGPVSYEQAFDAAKVLRAAHIEDPFSGEYEDARVQAAWDAIGEWERANDLHMRGVRTVKKAQDIVRASTIWIGAGYTTPDIVQAALDRMNDEYADALREGDEEVQAVLASGIESIEQRLAPLNPSEKKIVELQEKLGRGRQLIAEKKFTKAIGLLYGALTDPFFKKNRKAGVELQEQLKAELALAEAGYAEERARRVIDRP